LGICSKSCQANIVIVNTGFRKLSVKILNFVIFIGIQEYIFIRHFAKPAFSYIHESWAIRRIIRIRED
jgi:hypothetical protein